MSVYLLRTESEREGLIAVHNVHATNADQRELELLAQFHSVVAVLHHLESIQRQILIHLVPLHDAGLDLVHHAQQHQTIAQVLEQVVHEGLHAQRVHPQRECACFTGALAGKEPLLELRLLLFGEGLETGVGVEQIGDKRCGSNVSARLRGGGRGRGGGE
jgi:hypothetical protein